MSTRRARRRCGAALLALAAAMSAACGSTSTQQPDVVAWGTMGHGARQSQRSSERMLWSLAVRAPDVLLEVDGRSVVLKDAVGRGDLRYALRDEFTPRIWLELPGGARLDWDGIELASDDGYWRLEREGRYELSLEADEPLAYLGL